METTFIRQVRRVSIFERRFGSGPEVVVLHGGPGAHHDYLLPGFDALATGRTLVYYDQRGGGRSPVSRDTPVGWRDQVADLEALREIWGSRKLDLCGYSWGAMLALLYAREYPEKVNSLALVSPAPAAWQERKTFEANLRARGSTPALEREREELRRSELRNSNPEHYQQRLFQLAVAGYFHHPALAREMTPFRVTGRTQQEVWNSLGENYDLRPSLRQLHLKAIVVHGDDDPIPLATARSTAEALQATFTLLTDCGHVPHVEALTGLVAALDPFLPRLPR